MDIIEDSFHLHFNINILGAILTVQEAIKRFGAEGGSIINFSSIVGSHPVAGALLYASTKGAIETLTKDWRSNLRRARSASTPSLPAIQKPRAMWLRGPLMVVLARFWLGRRRSAGLVVLLICPLAVLLASDESAWITGEVMRAAGGFVVAT